VKINQSTKKITTYTRDNKLFLDVTIITSKSMSNTNTQTIGIIV